MAASSVRAWDEAGEDFAALRRALAKRLQAPAKSAVREAPPISERLLQAIWYDGLFHGDNLRLADGRPITIRSPGRWNGEAGPDFLKAELVIDGKPVNGDVELHLRASDWRHHGHAPDPAYRRVVLHAVLEIDDGKSSDATPTGGAIPRLELRPVLHGDLDSLGEVVSTEDMQYQSPAMVGRCKRVLGRLGHDEQVDAFFESAAMRRMKGKVERLRTQLAGDDFEQVLWQALLTAMGHRGSKTLFFLLAKRVPIADLRRLTRPWAGRARVLAAQAVLLHVANLVRPAPTEEPLWDDETMKHLDAINRVWAELGGHFSDRVIPPTAAWHRGVRPANFPSRRIAGVSHLGVGETAGEDGLFASLMRHCADFASDSGDDKTLARHREHLESLLAVEEPNDFWARRHTLGGKRAAKPMTLIGEGRARSVIFNALLPLTVLWARRRSDKPLLRWAHESIRVFPALEENSVTKFMKYRVLGTPTPPKSLFRREMRQQALFHIFTDCCDHVTTSCDQCAFFSRLPK